MTQPLDLEKIGTPTPFSSNPDKILGNNILYAPQPKIDAPTGVITTAVGVTGTYVAGTTYSSNEKNLINNHTNQILQLEAAFVKLGILNKR